MGMRYILFRVLHELKKRTGFTQKLYPIFYEEKEFISLEKWKETAPKFFFDSKEELGEFDISTKGKEILEKEFKLLNSGKFKFFSSTIFDLGKDYNWVTNPETDYSYDTSVHWTKIPDFAPERGDIKYVWEKSRFSYLYTLIRYDKHFGEDKSAMVFEQISDWIDKNPLNCGPNYVCSQEISLRVLNWTFALYYYKNSGNLTDDIFQKIMNSIFWQIKHVEANIDFSRIAVRNNHAMTESLMLFLSNLLFPFFEEFKKTSIKGKEYLKEEALFQIDNDGAYLQYTNNYHRIVIQLYTWYFRLAKIHDIRIEKEVLERLKKSYIFLYEHQNQDGKLPNYGVNDGALFFPLNSNEYMDYRPVLGTINYYFEENSMYRSDDADEDIYWLFGKNKNDINRKEKKQNEYCKYENDGYFVARKGEGNFMTFKCGNYRSRPAHADSLHVDYWSEGINLLRDSGMYKYNTDFDVKIYFWGTRGHNTIMIDRADQMLKGPRFNWFGWTTSEKAILEDKGNHFKFEGKIHAFKHLGDNIKHERKILYFKNEERIEIEDFIENSDLEKELIWNPHPEFCNLGYSLTVYDKGGNEISKVVNDGFYADYYGDKEPAKQWVYLSKGNYYRTVILKNAL